jgi:hypothetical protein
MTPNVSTKAPRTPVAGADVRGADVGRKAEVNHSGSVDEQLRFAIASKLLIQVSYSGSTRVVEPHDYGVQKGTRKLLAYQLRRTGGTQGKAVSGWRLLDVEKIEGCLVLEEAFRGSRGESHQHHYVWDLVYARVA